MNRTAWVRLALGVAFLTAIGGVYFAWQEGLLPAGIVKPPSRAPVTQNFLATLKSSPVVAHSLRPACLNLNPMPIRGADRTGRPGLRYQRMPGWGMQLVAQQPADGGVGNLAPLLDALAKAGIYTVSDVEGDDGAGNPMPAKAYTLTTAGWSSIILDQCFMVGTPQVTEIAEFSRIVPDPDGQRIYEVVARYATTDIPSWIDDARARGLLPDEEASKLRDPATARFRLRRTGSGWEVVPQETAVPELTPETALALIAKARSGAPMQACIRLPGKTSSPGFDIVASPFAATLLDIDAQGAFESRFAAFQMWQTRFGAMVKAGIFREERAEANPALNRPAGTRFVLDPAYQPWLDPIDATCLRMGDVTPEPVALYLRLDSKRLGDEQNGARAIAKFMLKLDKDAWIGKSSVALPEVDAVKSAGGVPVDAYFAWFDREGARTWQVASLRIAASDPEPPRLSAAALAAAAALYEKTPAAMADAGKPVAGAAPQGDVTWRFASGRGVSGKVTNEGRTAAYCCAGAYSMTLASRGVASGRVYAEFTFAATPGKLEGGTWSTIGVIPEPAPDAADRADVGPDGKTLWPQRENALKHRDVIGIAIDMDARQIFYSRNGAWLNGQPGGGAGIPLKSGPSQVVAALLTGEDTWTANFGKTQFRYPLPRGFRSYDGRPR